MKCSMENLIVVSLPLGSLPARADIWLRRLYALICRHARTLLRLPRPQAPSQEILQRSNICHMSCVMWSCVMRYVIFVACACSLGATRFEKW